MICDDMRKNKLNITAHPVVAVEGVRLCLLLRWCPNTTDWRTVIKEELLPTRRIVKKHSCKHTDVLSTVPQDESLVWLHCVESLAWTCNYYKQLSDRLTGHCPIPLPDFGHRCWSPWNLLERWWWWWPWFYRQLISQPSTNIGKAQQCSNRQKLRFCTHWQKQREFDNGSGATTWRASSRPHFEEVSLK